MNTDVLRPNSGELTTARAVTTRHLPRTPGLRLTTTWSKLRLVLVVCDALAIALAIVLTVRFSTYAPQHGLLDQLALVIGGTFAGLWAVRSQGLFLARVSAVRSVEIQRLVRAMALLAIAGLVADRVATIGITVTFVGVACAIAGGMLLVHRTTYRAWVGVARQAGRYRRNVVVVGTGTEGSRLVRLFDTHRELGIHVVGVVGDPDDAIANGLAERWLGAAEDTSYLVMRESATGVVVSPSDVEPELANAMIRDMQRAGVHVHLGTGVSGVDSRRLRALPLAHEPLLYVEAARLSMAQVVVKRAFDIVMSSLLIVVCAPLLVVISVAIKMTDRGPAFFKQRRVGRNGVEFEVIKFRSMVVDAEARLAALQLQNERQGELFKMTKDPRVTRVGKFLRDSSLDELPQLFNVLKGEMSLVGPRPALLSEVERFSPALRARETVRPGITGLWQVEARDNPSFEAYTRLDLHYVENWSLALDLTIVLGTVEQVLTRFVGLVRRR